MQPDPPEMSCPNKQIQKSKYGSLWSSNRWCGPEDNSCAHCPSYHPTTLGPRTQVGPPRCCQHSRFSACSTLPLDHIKADQDDVTPFDRLI